MDFRRLAELIESYWEKEAAAHVEELRSIKDEEPNPEKQALRFLECEEKFWREVPLRILEEAQREP